MIGGPKQLVTEAQQRMSFTRRSFILRGAQTAVGGVLLARMGWLSIAESQHYQMQSEANRVNLALIPPRRGVIIDRVGKPMALNRTTFRVDAIPDRMGDKAKTIATLAQILNLSAEDRDKINEGLADAAGFQPVQIADNLSYEAYSALSIREAELPGIVPAQGYSRFYPAGAAAAHLLGYVGAASVKQYQDTHNPLLITPGYKVGKDGLELTLEPRLQGQPGARRSEVTARGRWVRDLTNKPDVPGQTTRLTIDADLQSYVARRLGPASGACVVMDCMTGDVLALSSMPAYDPNTFSGGISKAEWQMLQANDHLPMNNKALKGLYPSGSTIKPLMALALLEAGVSPDEHVVCTGSYRVGTSIFHCDKRTGHGAISMHNAIVHSCDIYFYHMGRQLGIDRMAAMMRRMALGSKFDIPVNAQRYGTVPDPAWLQRRYHRNWSIYDTINASIGQGYLLVNPIQLAVMAARLASGRAIAPRLLLDRPHTPAPPLGIDPAHIDFVRKGMFGVVNEGGTAAASRLDVNGAKLAGKTGTAQVRRISLAERAHGVRSNASLPWKFRDHSLFIGFAPADNPKYAAACIIEHGGAGAQAAAPMVRDTMQFLLDPTSALATLATLEEGWGGNIEQRMAKARAQWAAEHPSGIQPPPPPTAGNAVDNAADNGADTSANSADTPPARGNGDKPTKRTDADAQTEELPAAPESTNKAIPAPEQQLAPPPIPELPPEPKP